MSNRVDYLTRINAVAKTCYGDDHLFARYGYKFMKDFEKENSEIIKKELQQMPIFQSEFQEIYMTGLLEHYFGKEFLPWMTNKKLDKNWYFLEHKKHHNPEKYKDSIESLKFRRIYV